MTSLENTAKKVLNQYLKVCTFDVALRKAKAVYLGQWDSIFDKVAKNYK